jgi:hypothetical protein
LWGAIDTSIKKLKNRVFSKRVANFVYKLMFETKVKLLFFYLSPSPQMWRGGIEGGEVFQDCQASQVPKIKVLIPDSSPAKGEEEEPKNLIKMFTRRIDSRDSYLDKF